MNQFYTPMKNVAKRTWQFMLIVQFSSSSFKIREQRFGSKKWKISVKVKPEKDKEPRTDESNIMSAMGKSKKLTVRAGEVLRRGGWELVWRGGEREGKGVSKAMLQEVYLTIVIHCILLYVPWLNTKLRLSRWFANELRDFHILKLVYTYIFDNII